MYMYLNISMYTDMYVYVYIYIYTVHSPGMNLNEFSLAAFLYISSMGFQMHWYTTVGF